MNKILLAAFTAAALSGCAGGQVTRDDERPLLPPQPVMSADGPVSTSGGAVTWDGRGVFIRW